MAAIYSLEHRIFQSGYFSSQNKPVTNSACATELKENKEKKDSHGVCKQDIMFPKLFSTLIEWIDNNEQWESKDGPLRHFRSNGKLFKGLRIDAHELISFQEVVLRLWKALIAYVIII